MDINVSFIEDCRLLAKQCKMDDLTEDLQHKCKQVYEYGKNLVLRFLCIDIIRYYIKFGDLLIISNSHLLCCCL